MKFEDLESMWKLPPNQLSLDAVDEGRRELMPHLRRVRRRRAILKAAGFVLLNCLSVIALARIFGMEGSAWDRVRGVTSVIAVALPWVLSAYLTPWFRRRQARLAAAAPTISAGLHARLVDNGAIRRMARWGAIGLGLVVAATPVLVQRMDAAGFVRDGIVVPTFGVCAALLLALGAGVLWYDRRRLLPRRRELESLLAEHRTEG